MARRPTQRNQDAAERCHCPGEYQRSGNACPHSPPLGPEPKRLSQRQSRDLIPASIIRLGHPEKQRRPLLHQDTVSPKQPTQRGSPSSKGRVSPTQSTRISRRPGLPPLQAPGSQHLPWQGEQMPHPHPGGETDTARDETARKRPRPPARTPRPHCVRAQPGSLPSAAGPLSA